MNRFDQKNLKLEYVIKDGKLLGKSKWVKVKELAPITNTSFPDIAHIKLSDNEIPKCAEVKFITSSFNYHNSFGSSHIKRFENFIASNGFILVTSHDYLPKYLLEKYPTIDVLRIEIEDFITFCKENFSRLLNRQIKRHVDTKVWLMYQGPNFNKGNEIIAPARKSYRWCPTENLSGFELTVGDRILFVKTSGSSTQEVQKLYLNNHTFHEKWTLNELWIGEVSSKIFSRSEYCHFRKISFDSKLWLNDNKKDQIWRWSRVFDFRPINEVKLQIPISEIAIKNPQFARKMVEVFCYGKSREIRLFEYRNLIESLL